MFYLRFLIKPPESTVKEVLATVVGVVSDKINSIENSKEYCMVSGIFIPKDNGEKWSLLSVKMRRDSSSFLTPLPILLDAIVSFNNVIEAWRISSSYITLSPAGTVVLEDEGNIISVSLNSTIIDLKLDEG